MNAGIWIALGVALLIVTVVYAIVAKRDRVHREIGDRYADEERRRRAIKRANG